MTFEMLLAAQGKTKDWMEEQFFTTSCSFSFLFFFGWGEGRHDIPKVKV